MNLTGTLIEAGRAEHRRLLVRTTNALVFLLVAGGAVLKFAVHGYEAPPLPALAVALMALGNAVYLERHGSTTLSAWLLLGLLLTGLAFTGGASGGLLGPVPILAPIVPVVAIMMLGSRAGWISLGAVVVIVSCLQALNVHDLLPPNPNGATGILVGRYISILSASLVITWIVHRFAVAADQLVAANWRAAHYDHLTGLANRRSVEQAMVIEIGRAVRGNTWLSLVMLDVDHFKQYNDRHGHPAGDRCLEAVAGTLMEHTRRPGDLAGRFGGEEFLLLLPDTDPEGAEHVAEAVRADIEALPLVANPDTGTPVTATLGIASVEGTDIRGVEELLRIADDALYKGKESGRNRVVGTIIRHTAESTSA